jgi:histidinol-phosphate aminotransferase
MAHRLQPNERVARLAPYRRAERLTPVDLHLDANEGAPPSAGLLESLPSTGELLSRYPDTSLLKKEIAALLAIDEGRLLVSAGGDEALDRVFRAYLGPGQDVVLPVPTFEMLPRYAGLVGARIIEVPWPAGAFPTDAVIDACTPSTAVVVVVSPNSPTGALATGEDLRRLSAALPDTLLLCDLAYIDFADHDLRPVVFELDNAVAVCTLSKAWGLAGLRVGYIAGPAAVIEDLKRAGSPYAVSSMSAAIALARLQSGGNEVAAFVSQVRRERQALTDLLQRLGGEPQPSQANFVYTRFADASWVSDALAGLGIAVRGFATDWLRITCPGDEASYTRLVHALETAIEPQALLFDLDGVLADVSASYREAIRRTALSYGVDLDAARIARAKTAGQANNDWLLTKRLLAEQGVDADLAEVTERFESIYQGEDGLWRRERPTTSRQVIARLASALPLAVVTGRPRRDAERFLRTAGIDDLFAALICMEDAPAKPDPEPVRRALARLGVRRGWLVGDTPDDVVAARAAGMVPLGMVAPGDDARLGAPILLRAGAARVISNVEEIACLMTKTVEST